MSCNEIESRILDYQENQLSPAQREQVETHLAGCANCRTFARRLQELDATLSTAVKVPVLSSGFDRQLWERLEAAPAAWSEAQRAARKRQLEVEFEAGAAQIARRSFALGNLLNHLMWPVVAIVAGWVAWRLTAGLTAHLNPEVLDGLAPTLLPWLAASAVFLGVGLAEAFPRQRRFLGI